jgi:hypothetical protein
LLASATDEGDGFGIDGKIQASAPVARALAAPSWLLKQRGNKKTRPFGRAFC